MLKKDDTAHGYTDIVRKTADSVWTFLLFQICNILQRIIDLAIALQPISKALQTIGTGHINVVLLGYELRLPTNLHELMRSHFNACLASYLDLDVKDTLRTIGLHGRTDDPERILPQARPHYYSRNLNDGLSDSHILQQSGDDVPPIDQRDIESPEGVVQASNNGNLQDDHYNGNDLQEGGDNSIQSDQSVVENVEGVAAISFPRFLTLGTSVREDPIYSNNNLNDRIILVSQVQYDMENNGYQSQIRSSSTHYRGTISLMLPEFGSRSMLQLPLLCIAPQSTSTHFSTRYCSNMQAESDNAYERIVKLESSPQPELDSEDEKILCLFDKTPTSYTISMFSSMNNVFFIAGSSIQRDNILEQPYNISPIHGDLISQPSLQARHHTLQANLSSLQSPDLQHDCIQLTCSPSPVTSMQYYKEAVAIEPTTSLKNVPQTPQLEVVQDISPLPDTRNIEDAISPKVWEDLIVAIEEDDSFPSIP
ncbi:hypothetical protein L873DRAFT_1847268 [Choiromyces venosus 120613-1]|uniref:Uncharacterized protein n=1 Tax=Choiromyces venosus 120613-1 TaxID=1336337 RepID=A0A3N4J4N8_9PEZI|nr:hypothetical protein L873DRAFT_1847268 [Choiromyces venosus 120613-1]